MMISLIVGSSQYDIFSSTATNNIMVITLLCLITTVTTDGGIYNYHNRTNDIGYIEWLQSVFVCCFFVLLVFVAVPTSQEVAVDREAVFRCRHSTADTIRWRLDGMLIGGSPPPDVTPSSARGKDGNLVQILTIVASPQYNGSEVVCVARFDDGSPDETTLPATLQGRHVQLLQYGTFRIIHVYVHSYVQ